MTEAYYGIFSKSIILIDSKNIVVKYLLVYPYLSVSRNSRNLYLQSITVFFDCEVPLESDLKVINNWATSSVQK